MEKLKRQTATFPFGLDIQTDTSKYCNKPCMNNLKTMTSEGIHKNSDAIVAGTLEILKAELKSMATKNWSLYSHNMEGNSVGKKLML